FGSSYEQDLGFRAQVWFGRRESDDRITRFGNGKVWIVVQLELEVPEEFFSELGEIEIFFKKAALLAGSLEGRQLCVRLVVNTIQPNRLVGEVQHRWLARGDVLLYLLNGATGMRRRRCTYSCPEHSDQQITP